MARSATRTRRSTGEQRPDRGTTRAGPRAAPVRRHAPQISTMPKPAGSASGDSHTDARACRRICPHNYSDNALKRRGNQDDPAAKRDGPPAKKMMRLRTCCDKGRSFTNSYGLHSPQAGEADAKARCWHLTAARMLDASARLRSATSQGQRPATVVAAAGFPTGLDTWTFMARRRCAERPSRYAGVGEGDESEPGPARDVENYASRSPLG